MGRWYAGPLAFGALAAFCVSALGSIGCNEPKTPGEAVTSRKSDKKAREKVSITVYNQNFGLVREIRGVELGSGHVELEFADVSAHIQPETVALKPLDDPDALTVLEQNYRYDLLTPEKLLEKYVGKQVKVFRWNEEKGEDEEHDAEVLAVEGGLVLKMGDEITTNFPGRVSFPEVPPNLIPKPSLVWLLDSKVASQRVELTYLTQNLSWKADYVLVVDKDDKVGDIQGWVTLSNDTGTDYEHAELKLVAGDVQKIQAETADYSSSMRVRTAAEQPAPQFSEEGLFEYHLYTLQRPTTLLDKEQKQVTLLSAAGIGVHKKLIFFGDEYYYRGEYGEVVSNQKVGVYLDVQNSKANHLGIPLPKGIVRVYKEDASGARQFIGEDAIDHTPRDEKIRVKMGDAFDVVGDRKQMSWKTFGLCVSESRWKIELRNHKDKAETVEIYEPVGGDWEVMESSHPAKKKDAHTFTFEVNVPPNGKTEVTYRVRVRWC